MPSGRKPIWIAASALQSGTYKPGFRDMVVSELTERTAIKAYEDAAIAPEDVDVAEIHDAFSIAELMYYEALKLCAVGKARRCSKAERTEISGRKCVNPSGGLLCRGHPVGATGIAQVCEAVWQLRGEPRTGRSPMPRSLSRIAPEAASPARPWLLCNQHPGVLMQARNGAGPLSHVTVLDMTQFLAGPYGSQILGIWVRASSRSKHRTATLPAMRHRISIKVRVLIF